MTTVNSVLDIQSSHTELGKQIVSSVVAKLNEGNIADAVHHFGANFKFSDHALGLEFNDKARLEEFFYKTHELFPDAHLDVTACFESETTLSPNGRSLRHMLNPLGQEANTECDDLYRAFPLWLSPVGASVNGPITMTA